MKDPRPVNDVAEENGPDRKVPQVLAEADFVEELNRNHGLPRPLRAHRKLRMMRMSAMGLLDQVIGSVLGSRMGNRGGMGSGMGNDLGGGMGGGGGLGGMLGGGGTSPLMMALMALLASRGGGGLGGLLGGGSGGLGGMVGGGSSTGMGGMGGLGGLLEQFTRSGHGDRIQSWIGPGDNHPIAPNELEDALGPDTIDNLSQQTGMERHEMLNELSHVLPGVVDQLTPHGRLPSDEEVQHW
jgi:uncharacterized protein YidB (DUF937 family)